MVLKYVLMAFEGYQSSVCSNKLLVQWNVVVASLDIVCLQTDIFTQITVYFK